MNQERLAEFIGTVSITIVDAMEKIDRNSRGILFIVDENGMLAGCITDGDVRRWIIKAGALNASVEKAMNASPRYLFSEERKKAVTFMRQQKIVAVPVLDRRMRIVDIVFLAEETDHGEEKPKRDLSGVPVVVMAGGKGTRLYPYTKILPKPLVPIGDTPIVERIMNRFAGYGIDKYYMTVNYKKGMIKSYFADIGLAYEIVYVEEEKPLGTGGGIRLIRETFDRPLFVTNCDALIMADYADLYDYHARVGNAITIVSALKIMTVPYGVIHSGADGEILDMEEKPKLSYLVNTGMYIINPEMIGLIPDNQMFHMTHLVEAAMKAGKKVGAYPVSEDSFLDMGEFGEMKRMEEKLDIVSKQ